MSPGKSNDDEPNLVEWSNAREILKDTDDRLND